MDKASSQAPQITDAGVLVLAVDGVDGNGAPRRLFRVGRGSDLASPRSARLQDWDGHGRLPVEPALGGSVFVLISPTRTYSEGFGGAGTCDIAPEDRAMIRGLRR